MRTKGIAIAGVVLLLVAAAAVVTWMLMPRVVAGSTPSGAVEAVFKAVAAEDYGGVFDFMFSGARGEIEKELASLKKDSAQRTPEDLERRRAELPGDLDKMSARDYFEFATRARVKRDPELGDRFKSLAGGRTTAESVSGDSGRVRFTLGPPLGGEGAATVVREGGRWFVEELTFFEESRRHVVRGLGDLVEGEKAFASLAGNSTTWVGDVRGLYAGVIRGEPVVLAVGMPVPAADSAAKGPGEWDLDGDGEPDFKIDAEGIAGAGPTLRPYRGYYFRVIPLDENGTAYATIAGVAGRDRFAFCAYPSEYGATGVTTFAVDETGTVLTGDSGGKPLERFPKDWKPVR